MIGLRVIPCEGRRSQYLHVIGLRTILESEATRSVVCLSED